MPQVTLNVNNTPYQFTCNEGEQERLRERARMVDARVMQLGAALGQVGEAKLILMAALILVDELAENGAGKLSKGELVSHLGDIETLAAQIEHIAARME